MLFRSGHFDHIMALDDIRRVLRCPCIAYVDEESLLEDSQLNCSTMTSQQLQIKADRFVKNGEVISLADIDITVLHTPGHTQGSCCYYLKDYKSLFSGDTLFLESLGRTDLPTGNGMIIVQSIKDKLFPLDELVQVYPGHGSETSIGYEKKYNPYLVN